MRAWRGREWKKGTEELERKMRERERERERDLRQQIHQVFDEVPLSKQKIAPQSLCGFVGE